MIDKMRQADNVAVQLECGHPNKKAGEMCTLCGQVVPGVQSTADTLKEPAGQGLKDSAHE